MNKESKLTEDLEELIEKFNNLRHSFNNYRKKGEVNSSTLIEFESRFINLKADLRPIRKFVTGEWRKRDDKAATAIKFRIALAIHEGEFKDSEGKLIYDQCSINQAEKFASGSQAYKEFIDQRSFWKECEINTADLRNDLEGFINLIKDILKSI